MSRKKCLLPQACVPSTSFLKKFANVRLTLTIERLPKSLISYPDLFLTKQALSIREITTSQDKRSIKQRSEFDQTQPVLGQSKVTPQARL